MDGVLIDSEKIHYESTKTMLLEKFEISIDFAYYKQFIGGTVTNMWNTIIDDYSLLVTPEVLNDYSDKIIQDILKETGYPAIPGVVRFVKELKENTNISLAVASSAKLERIEKILVQLGISEYFDVKMSGEKLGKSKPDPTIFIETVKKLGLSCKECLVIEDSYNGIMAAYNAGIPCLGFDQDGMGIQDMYKADAVFYSFENIDKSYIDMIYGHSVGEPVVILETERLRIREISVDDVDRIYELYSHKDITKYMPPLYEDKDLEIEYTKNYIENIYGFYNYGIWIVEEKVSGEVIGRVGCEYKEYDGITAKHELGYMIGVDYQGKGYAKEALEAVVKHMKQNFDVNEFYVEISKENKVSRHIAEKMGFKFEEKVNKNGYFLGVLDKV